MINVLTVTLPIHFHFRKHINVFRLNFKSIHKYFYNEGTKIRTPFVKEAW